MFINPEWALGFPAMKWLSSLFLCSAPPERSSGLRTLVLGVYGKKQLQGGMGVVVGVLQRDPARLSVRYQSGAGNNVL